MARYLASALLGLFQGFCEKTAALHQGLFIGRGRAQRGEDSLGLHLMACLGHDDLQQAMLMQLSGLSRVPASRDGRRARHISDVIMSSFKSIAHMPPGTMFLSGETD